MLHERLENGHYVDIDQDTSGSLTRSKDLSVPLMDISFLLGAVGCIKGKTKSLSLWHFCIYDFLEKTLTGLLLPRFT